MYIIFYDKYNLLVLRGFLQLVSRPLDNIKVTWPQPFEDGDVEMFLRKFEAIAEPVGVRRQRAEVTILGTVVRGCVGGGCSQTEFNNPANREVAS